MERLQSSEVALHWQAEYELDPPNCCWNEAATAPEVTRRGFSSYLAPWDGLILHALGVALA